MIQQDIFQFIYTCIPQEYPTFLQCRLRRDTSGVQGNFFPTFYLQAERPSDGRKVFNYLNKRTNERTFPSFFFVFIQMFLLAARRIAKVNRLAEYNITTNVESISRSAHGDGYVGKLRGNNLSGTQYTLYDNGISPNKISKSKRGENQENLRRELAAIVYVI